MNVRIRRATTADAAAVAGLIDDMARAFGGVREMEAAYVEVYLAHPGTSILLAETGDGPVGLVAYAMRPNLYHGGSAGAIEELVVRADMRRRGVGGALLREAMGILKEAGCVEVAITTDLENRQAQSLYRAAGLTEENLELSLHFRPRTDTAFCRPAP